MLDDTILFFLNGKTTVERYCSVLYSTDGNGKVKQYSGMVWVLYFILIVSYKLTEKNGFLNEDHQLIKLLIEFLNFLNRFNLKFKKMNSLKGS